MDQAATVADGRGNGPFRLDVRRCAADSRRPGAEDFLQRPVRPERSRRDRPVILTNCLVARVGPTTPKQLGQSEVASVDPTDARLRNARLSCRGRLKRL